MREVPQSLANSQTLAKPFARIQNLRLAHSLPRVYDAPAPLRLWHLTSLDAPTVAVVWTLAFAWVAEVALPLWVPVLLALAAWAVYIGDRLLDARSALRAAHHRRLRLRHRFHWRHRRIFLPIAIAAAGSAAVIVFSFMPVAARERNSVLAAAALVYFTRVHSFAPTHSNPVHSSRNRTRFPSVLRVPFGTPLVSRILSKEMLVGLLFTAACVLPAFTRSAQPSSNASLLILPAVFFALLAWLNCHAIEHWESRNHPAETPRILPTTAIFAPALALSLAGMLIAAALAEPHPRSAALLAAGALSALLLAILDRRRSRLTPLALRTTADLVLLTPIALFFIR
ncbi:MAG: hypothetical protein ABR923_01200 [Terracidiphilus sp.]